MKSNLSYKEKCDCVRSNFCTYVNHEKSFSSKEKIYLIQIILNDNISGVLYVSSILAAWSLIVTIIDFILFPGIIIYAIYHGVIDYKVLTPPILFLVGNVVAKFIYISVSLKGKVMYYDIIISILPYAGSAYLLKKFLIKDKLLSKAVYDFLKMKKQRIKNQFVNFFRKKHAPILLE
ncbi:hypothetical protein [Ancylomarina sp. 16SWW S1-10-2]|uniref:hypothetical protein n=1 Tax=Ancylomarina sp. 16SWW S1-10-2 TaxID=2499681 RepID=UPI0012AE7618|nr:hypothetical protein [Ancylomarina sp. 16SWW S1-10-2]MRT94050.1 hypothetical protein [Ancylomarina sp. 16SWW S1-10-2]